MIVQFNYDLTTESIYANGNELAQIMGLDRDEDGRKVESFSPETRMYVTSIRNPVLVTDIYRISMLEPVMRDTVAALLASPVRTTEFENTSVTFRQAKYPAVWGPSIDTLLFTKALKSIDFSGVRTAVEIGCGSGFISKYVLNNAPGLEKITLVDINKSAIDCAIENIDDQRADFVVGDGLDFIDGKRFDLILCNPPYIPRPDNIAGNAYEGIGLLRHFVIYAGYYLEKNGLLVTNISSLCRNDISGMLKKLGLVLEELVEEIAAMDVPLKIMNVLNNEKWLDFLVKNKGLMKSHHDGYDYWHRISICQRR
jgi:tRNA1(Val) A37 N6-methylase TrmN6